MVIWDYFMRRKWLLVTILAALAVGGFLGTYVFRAMPKVSEHEDTEIATPIETVIEDAPTTEDLRQAEPEGPRVTVAFASPDNMSEITPEVAATETEDVMEVPLTAEPGAEEIKQAVDAWRNIAFLTTTTLGVMIVSVVVVRLLTSKTRSSMVK